MNTGLRPLPRSMPFLARASLMVTRGEARTFAEATRLLRAHKRAHKRAHCSTTITDADRASFAHVERPASRLPYADN
jgi:hypothetical protein